MQTLCHRQQTAGRSDRQMRQVLGKINTVVMENCDNLAPYQFLTAFSQLISRVCHSSNEVFNVLMTIVAKVFLAYPQQAMWLMTAVSKVCVWVSIRLSRPTVTSTESFYLIIQLSE